MKSLITKTLAASALMTTTLTANALHHEPVNGLYLGATNGFSYVADVKNATMPTVSTLTTTSRSVNLQYKLGYNLGVNLGYRIKNRFRIEGEFFMTFNNPRRIIIGSTKVPNDVYGISGRVNTKYGGFINGIFDLIPKDDFRFNQAIPYLGVGIGKAKQDIATKIERNGAYLSTPFSSEQSVNIGQVIVGVLYFLDDYSNVGFDYRYMQTAKITTYNKSLARHNLNITMNIALDDYISRNPH
jgi:opacity protein-like surface antigen